MLKKLFRYTAPLLLAVALSACGTMRQYNPVSYAETPEQRAYAVYGSFVVAEEQGAALIKNPSVPDSVKLKIQEVDLRAKPIADNTLEAADTVAQVRRDLAIGKQKDETVLETVTNRLAEWYTALVPVVNDLIALVEGDK